MNRHNEMQVVMLRHAQSEWNQQDRFSGWADPRLTDAGRAEAVAAGQNLAAAGYRFDQAFSSRLLRAGETGQLVLEHSGNGAVPMARDWRLNERHYGALQGLNKTQTAKLVGEQQVWRWRRGYLDHPTAMPPDDPEHPAQLAAWTDIPKDQLPNGENLAETRARVMRFWEADIVPRMHAGQRLLISSHGNTLRALLMALGRMSVEAVESFEIPTGMPIIYRFDASGRALGWDYLSASREAA